MAQTSHNNTFGGRAYMSRRAKRRVRGLVFVMLALFLVGVLQLGTEGALPAGWQDVRQAFTRLTTVLRPTTSLTALRATSPTPPEPQTRRGLTCSVTGC